MTVRRAPRADPPPTITRFRPDRRRGQSTAPGHGLWLLASPAELAAVLAGDPASPLPAAQRLSARRALAGLPPLAVRGLQRVDWADEDGRRGSLTFAIGLGRQDRRRLLAAFEASAGPPASPGPATDAGRNRGAPVLVIGAGLAGCAMAAALARRGRRVVIADREAVPGGVVAAVPLLAQHPALSADDNARTRLSRAALTASWRLRKELGPALHWCGRWQRVEGDSSRYLAGWPLELAHAAGPPAAGLVRFERCALAETAPLLAHLLARPTISRCFGQSIAAIERDADDWWAGLAGGRKLGPFEAVVVACPDHERFTGLTPPWTPPGQRTSSQVAIADAASDDAPARIDGGFRPDRRPFRLQLGRLRVTGADGGGDGGSGGGGGGGGGSVGDGGDGPWRLSRPAPRFDPVDHLPLVGAVPDQARVVADAAAHTRNDRLPYPLRPGLWLATGLGGRGLLWSCLAAELIAGHLDDEPPLIEATLEAAIDPARFLRRRLRQGPWRE